MAWQPEEVPPRLCPPQVWVPGAVGFLSSQVSSGQRGVEGRRTEPEGGRGTWEHKGKSCLGVPDAHCHPPWESPLLSSPSFHGATIHRSQKLTRHQKQTFPPMPSRGALEMPFLDFLELPHSSLLPAPPASSPPSPGCSNRLPVGPPAPVGYPPDLALPTTQLDLHLPPTSLQVLACLCSL